MNWKKTAIWLWPLLAWPSTLISWIIYYYFSNDMAPYAFSLAAYQDIFRTFFGTVMIPYTLFFLALAIASCIFWVRKPSLITFTATLLTIWIPFSPSGVYIYILAPVYLGF